MNAKDQATKENEENSDPNFGKLYQILINYLYFISISFSVLSVEINSLPLSSFYRKFSERKTVFCFPNRYQR